MPFRDLQTSDRLRERGAWRHNALPRGPRDHHRLRVLRPPSSPSQPPRRPAPSRDLQTSDRLREWGAWRHSALPCDPRDHHHLRLLRPPDPPPQPPQRPVPFRDLQTNNRLRERGAWRNIALLCDLRTGDCCTLPIMLQLPKIPIPSRNLRTSDRLRGVAAEHPEVGATRRAIEDFTAAPAPGAVLRPPDRRLSEGVGSTTAYTTSGQTGQARALYNWGTRRVTGPL